MEPTGAARIQFGQYYAWRVGDYHGQEALRQTFDITVCRDMDEDCQRDGDKTYTGNFGMHHHWGYDYPVDDMKDSGAGCLIGRTKAGHRQFMKLVKTDPRYQASNGLPFAKVKAVVQPSQAKENPMPVDPANRQYLSKENWEAKLRDGDMTFIRSHTANAPYIAMLSNPCGP